MTSTASLYTILNAVYDSTSHALRMVLNYVHTHADATHGGQLDWDVVWSDAVHSHASAGEGGTIDHGTAITGLTDDDHTQYALRTILTAEGDVPYRNATVWTKKSIGTAGQVFRVNAGATAPEWGDSGYATKEFLVPFGAGSGGVEQVVGNFSIYTLDTVADYTSFSFRVPADFTSLTSVKAVIIPPATGTIDWTVTTSWGAAGEASTTHTDSATADAQAVTATLILELDISSAYTGLAVNDVVGTKLTLDAQSAANVYAGVIGLNVKYV